MFRCLRALRPLRVVSKNEGIKTVVNSLIRSIPGLLNVMLIICLFLVVFGILGVQLWKGGQSYCDCSENYSYEEGCPETDLSCLECETLNTKSGCEEKGFVW